VTGRLARSQRSPGETPDDCGRDARAPHLHGSLDARDAKIELVNKGSVDAVVTVFRDLDSLMAEQEMERGRPRPQ